MTCSRCGVEPRQGSHRWGAECRKRYREEQGVTAAPLPDVHCEVCRRPRDPEPWLPPLDDKTGWRVLGQDPMGWAEDHGPDFGLVCCRTFICYDARPGHRAWPRAAA